VGAAMLAACVAPEHALLDRFFGASRLRDTTALQAISTTIFEPLQHGIVRTFEVTGVTAQRTEGQTVTKDVTIDASVILHDGRMRQKTLVVTLQRASADRRGRWLITGIREPAPSPQAPPS
jgi:hypothetical protein